MAKPSGNRSTLLAPFLSKCYDLLEDESTDPIISWGGAGDSFVIWDITQFTLQLLPQYFKHSNFSSFMRQLNIYGFRKVDSDRWEFSNDGFVKGQKHLLKNIRRRKNVQVMDQKISLQKQDNSVEEVDKIKIDGLWKEVENLKIDKKALSLELGKLRQLQETSENKLVLLRDRIQRMENNQQQMLSFLVLAMQNPEFLVQLLQPKENHCRVTEMGNMLEQQGAENGSLISEGTIVKYQPPTDGNTNPELSPLSGSGEMPKSGPSFDGKRDVFMNNDLTSILMNEKFSLDTPLVFPDSPDDGAWEKLLLACPFIESASEKRQDNEGPNYLGMDTESAFSGASSVSHDFDALIRLMGNPQEAETESEVDGDDWEDAPNVDFLAEQMEYLASNSDLKLQAT
ncbi:heat stress transcription factor A-8 [Rhodamnia argentea]|uniref:Heat stress transcription factor A-8 n=1 Tax=Rhodamnia argentea TaxID=178133 RepID=A0A8B8R5G5_9MYRT|nr:heat stress transcription factor A-8 [Rhodamnia argentea]